MFSSFQRALETYFLQSLVPESIAGPVLKALTQFAGNARSIGAGWLFTTSGEGATWMSEKAMLAVRSIVAPIVDASMKARADQLRAALRLADPAHADGVPPVDDRLGVAIQDGHAALEHGSATELV